VGAELKQQDIRSRPTAKRNQAAAGSFVYEFLFVLLRK
jgi:hypothetical protein